MHDEILIMYITQHYSIQRTSYVGHGILFKNCSNVNPRMLTFKLIFKVEHGYHMSLEWQVIHLLTPYSNREFQPMAVLPSHYYSFNIASNHIRKSVKPYQVCMGRNQTFLLHRYHITLLSPSSVGPKYWPRVVPFINHGMLSYNVYDLFNVAINYFRGLPSLC